MLPEAACAMVHRIQLHLTLGLITVLPIAWFPGTFLWFDITPKVAVLSILIGLASMAGLFCGKSRDNGPHALAFRLSVPVAILFGLALVAGLSTAFSVAPSLSLGGSNWRRLGLPTELAVFASLILLTTVAGRGRVNAIAMQRATCLGLLFASISVLLSATGVLETQSEMRARLRPGGFLGSGPSFACYALAPIFLTTNLWLCDPVSAWRALALSSGLIGLFAVLLSGTRAAGLGILVGLTVLLIRNAVVFRNKVPLLCFSTVALGLLSVQFQQVRDRLGQIAADPIGGTRLAIWGDCLRLLPALPPLGFGLEAFPRVFPEVQSLQTAHRFPEVFHESAHNYLLETLLEKGLLGLALVVALSWAGIKAASRGSEPHDTFYLAAHLAAFTGLLFFSPQVPALFFLYLPATLLWANSRSVSIHFPRMLSFKLSAPLLTASRRATAVMACALGLSFVAYAVFLLRWDHLLFRSQQRFRQGDVVGATSLFVQSRRLSPPGTSADLWFAREKFAASQDIQAVLRDRQVTNSLRVALAIGEEVQESALLLAAVLATSGSRNEALSLLCSIRDLSVPGTRAHRLRFELGSELDSDCPCEVGLGQQAFSLGSK